MAGDVVRLPAEHVENKRWRFIQRHRTGVRENHIFRAQRITGGEFGIRLQFNGQGFRRRMGIVSYMAIEREMGTVEIGHVTWSRRMKNTPLGTEAVWLLLKNGFDHGYRRLEWKCDSMNVASRRAAERLGFSWEGRLRQRLVRKGRTRDSDMLSIIDGEWPARDAALRAWLAAENFTADGQQIKRLEAFR
ncbi:GNAT family N-acetyltransferase [Klebsiella pneumoniae]|uniref:GNAT family N-acetyltransferase n=1 Tax=Klebsiella pneumoniae TaxID=573 RepID=UPI003CD02490